MGILQNLGNKPISQLIKEEGNKSFKNLTAKASNKLKRISEEMPSGGSIKRRRRNPLSVIHALEKLQQRLPKRKKKIVRKNSKGGSIKKKSCGLKKIGGRVKKIKKPKRKVKKNQSKAEFLKSIFRKN